ncbi:cytochrome BD ubiquinol oxidase subunit I [Actinotalea ferrariae CF5-4]|jgi:cytochrome d ubiquinol oxidase subunit I|uniref:Cytochrome BD ubiquinol oxidase subunit I n=1 Tax=Actinotalea ferrariae CF5-4 TaxID=948458 RepID=A0A021VQ08_9CELL|nr:cytochrome ubiquinol oxidase subunit I [Actinotalea ferrariae]EYR62125.1 cytochrome BD ubiquinol oxidase subunit I [Actinotalea ferrariae CF5-4]
MDTLELARLQFAVVTIYHYFFVPLSISLAALTAGLQTAWHRTGRPHYRELTLLVGKLLMVTFAVGVVTGLVQEFQFGLSWSDFARFYGDVFGPTLAIEGMLAFFLEATFLGLWFFGWDRLPRLAHLATIWVVAIGTLLSAFIILAANSFMQNPVAYEVDPRTGRAQLDSFWGLMVNEVNLVAYPHTIAGAAMTGGALLMAVGAWRAWGRGPTARGEQNDLAWRTLARLGGWVTAVAGLAVAITGDLLGKVMTAVQPMKMAAAEALYATQAGAPFSVFAIGDPRRGGEPLLSLDVPYLLSLLAHGDPGATVQGIDDLQAQYVQEHGPGDYVPWVPVAYWTFRLMIGTGMLAATLAVLFLWVTRRGQGLVRHGGGLAGATRGVLAGRSSLRTLFGTGVLACLPLLPALPVLANTFGWVFTETARQPWLVFGLFRTEDGVGSGLTSAEVLASLVGFGLVYGVLALVWYWAVRHLIAEDLTSGPVRTDGADADDGDRAPVPTY